MKYYLMRLKSSFEITRFPLFQNVNRNFFCLKYEQPAWSFKIFLAELLKEKSAGNLECVSKQPLRKSMSSIRPHSLEGNNEEISEEMFIDFFHQLFLITNFGSVCEIIEYWYSLFLNNKQPLKVF